MRQLDLSSIRFSCAPMDQFLAPSQISQTAFRSSGKARERGRQIAEPATLNESSTNNTVVRLQDARHGRGRGFASHRPRQFSQPHCATERSPVSRFPDLPVIAAQSREAPIGWEATVCDRAVLDDRPECNRSMVVPRRRPKNIVQLLRFYRWERSISNWKI